MWRLNFLAAIMGLNLLLSPSSECEPISEAISYDPDPLLAISQSDLIFSGHVLRLGDSGEHKMQRSSGKGIRCLFAIEEIWKGSARDTVTIVSNRENCNVDTTNTYLILAKKWRGEMFASLCRPVSESQPMLATLNALPVRGSAPKVDRGIVQRLISETQAPVESTRIEAAYTLGRLKLLPDLSIPALKSLYQHGVSKDRAAALWALAVPFKAKDFASTLRLATSDENPEVRKIALYGLEANNEPWTSECRASLQDQSPAVRSFALMNAKAQHLAPNEVIPQLIQAVNDSSWEIRTGAAVAIGEYPECGTPCAQALERLMRDPKVDVRSAARAAVLSLGPESAAAEALRMGLTDPDKDSRHEAVMRSLERYEGTPEVVPFMIHALGDTEIIIRYDALYWLSQSTGPYTCRQPLVLTAELRSGLITAVATTYRGTKDEDGLFSLSLEVLEKLGAVKETLPIFHKALSDDDPFVRDTAVRALERSGIDPNQLKP